MLHARSKFAHVGSRWAFGLFDIVGLTTDNQEAVVIAAMKVKLESLTETGEINFIFCPYDYLLNTNFS